MTMCMCVWSERGGCHRDSMYTQVTAGVSVERLLPNTRAGKSLPLPYYRLLTVSMLGCCFGLVTTCPEYGVFRVV